MHIVAPAEVTTWRSRSMDLAARSSTAGGYAGTGTAPSSWIPRNAVMKAIPPVTKTLSATNHGWMMPYTMFGMTKIPEEQGEWAGKIAIEILNGTEPSAIPIIPNRNFDIIVNNALLETAQIKLPEFIRLKAQPYYQ